MSAAAPEAVRSQRGTKLVDLSLEITNGMPAHALFPSPVWLPYVSHAESASAGLGEPGDPMTYAVSYLATLEHVGTHVDAPAHIKDGGDPVDQVPLDWFTGKAICLDLRHVGDLGDIDVADLERAEEQTGIRIDGHIVLICSGFHERHWPERTVVTSNPGITYDASHWLADRGPASTASRGRRPTRRGRRSSPTIASAATGG